MGRRRFPKRWARAWLAVTVLGGAVLWWATGRWQWPVTLIVMLIAGMQGYYAFNARAVLAAQPRMQQKLPVEPLAKELLDWGSWTAALTGLVVWAWTGAWVFAIVGVVLMVGLAAAGIVMMTRRHLRRWDVVVELIATARDDVPEQAIPNYERVMAMYAAEDPSPKLREHVAFATYQVATLKRGPDAVAAYERLLARFGHDSDPAIRKIIDRARKEWSPGA